MLRPWLVAMAGLLAVATRTQAQSRWDNLQSNVKSSVGDAWDVWTSPLRGRSKDWLVAAGAIGVSAAVSPLDASVDQWAVNHRDDSALNFLDPLRPGGWAFSGKTITPVAVGALALSIATNNQRLQEGIFGCATSYGASSVVRTFVVYPLLARTRPDPDRDNGPAAEQGDQYHFGFPRFERLGQAFTSRRTSRKRHRLRDVSDDALPSGQVRRASVVGNRRGCWRGAHTRSSALGLGPNARAVLRICGRQGGRTAFVASQCEAHGIERRRQSQESRVVVLHRPWRECDASRVAGGVPLAHPPLV